ncbi:MAG TPA: DUF3078 domain-containing protein [Bacteroidetes bacterium]|nr:DUF3078 domain-containing protein [Bacteroidota bacterium]
MVRYKKSAFFLSIFFLTGNILFAQEKEQSQYGWKKEVVGEVNLSQAGFDNWAQGGENSLVWQLNLNGKFVNDQEKMNWSNTGKFTFGRTKVGDQDSRKSIDELKLESVLTYKLGSLINPYIAATGETQSATGYRYEGETKVAVSGFLDPVYFTQSAGVGYTLNKQFKTRFGAAAKQTVTSNYPVPYADDPATETVEKTKSEIGAEFVTDLNLKLNKTTLLISKLELFSNLTAFDEIDVRWDNLVSAKISKYINVNFNVKLFYDKDISKKRQLKQALAVGFTYSFF